MQNTRPDTKTLEAYASKTLSSDWGTPSEAFRQWIRELSTGQKVLDVGCGNGKALLEMLDCGLNAVGTDASPEMVEASRNSLTAKGQDQIRVHLASLPGTMPFADESFDALSCCAVLMHLPEIQIFDAVQELTRLLRIGGKLYLSIPKTREDIDAQTQRDAEGRLFTPIQTHQLSLLLERMGLRLDRQSEETDSLARSGIVWSNLCFTRMDANRDCPLNLVEKVLNHDKKDATYKLALVRALAEIAQTEFHIAEFLPHGKVAIPLGNIADRWLWYYWPIFAHERFISQKNGEREHGGKNLAIRKKINDLIVAAGPGGLSAFHANWRRGTLSEGQKKFWKSAHSKLKSTIWNMPVRHAGGGKEFSVFQYNHDLKNPAIEMDAALWREFCLTGSWIQDATLLRWAELTEQLSRQQVKASEVLDCLLKRWDPDRDVQDARGYYLKNKSDLICVWTEKSVRTNFEVDHTLPYTLWKNNDLWNLLPALPSVNNQKRDSIPSTALLKARRDLIINYWSGLQTEFGDRFLRDAQTLMGREEFKTDNWENTLYSRLSEACEITATQRGVKRWQPDDFKASAVIPTISVPSTTPYSMRTQPPLYVTEGPGCTESPNPNIYSFVEVRNRVYRDCLPLVGDLAAGSAYHGLEVQGLEDPTTLDWIEVPEKHCDKNRFVVRVAGDSMEPKLPQGSLAIFEYHRRAPEGRKIVIANVPAFGNTSDAIGNETIKYLTQDSTHWIFESENPAYEPIRVAKIDCPNHPILGEFVGNFEP
ncbi:methyltransferase domain-containing protein [Kiritimatiellota bacterium B12222]|nr:methyltransferase domain-containing protein [Kiritimatiellota bacterium B12222]